MNKKICLITGVTGQVGSHLAAHLLKEGCEVVGGVRRTSAPNLGRIRHLLGDPNFRLVPLDVTDYSNVLRLLGAQHWDEVYCLAAQSYVKTSFDEPFHTTDATYVGCLNFLEALRTLRGQTITTRMYQASSSEMYGGSYTYCQDFKYCWTETGTFRADGNALANVADPRRRPHYYQREDTPFQPNSPYAIAKVAAHHACRLYRESYQLHVSCGIIFNTESEVRGEEFVTRKITRHVGRLVQAGREGKTLPKLQLGNLSAYRDWSHCEDTCRAMTAILRHDEPDDFCIGTGEAHSVDDFLRAALKAGGLDGDLSEYVEVSPANFRPCEVPFLQASNSKAHGRLGWQPTIFFPELVRRMVESDIELARQEVSHG